MMLVRPSLYMALSGICCVAFAFCKTPTTWIESVCCHMSGPELFTVSWWDRNTAISRPMGLLGSWKRRFECWKYNNLGFKILFCLKSIDRQTVAGLWKYADSRAEGLKTTPILKIIRPIPKCTDEYRSNSVFCVSSKSLCLFCQASRGQITTSYIFASWGSERKADMKVKTTCLNEPSFTMQIFLPSCLPR